MNDDGLVWHRRVHTRDARPPVACKILCERRRRMLQDVGRGRRVVTAGLAQRIDGLAARHQPRRGHSLLQRAQLEVQLHMYMMVWQPHFAISADATNEPSPLLLEQLPTQDLRSRARGCKLPLLTLALTVPVTREKHGRGLVLLL